MKRFSAHTTAVVAVLTLSALPLIATPGFWQAATQADFLRGDVEHVSVDEHGRVMLGPEVRRLHEAGVPFLWTLLPGPDGAVYLGTGNEGQVLRVDARGAGSVFYDSPEMEVHALAPAPDGGLYVGTSPEGRVYRVNAKGEATTFFDPEDKYIWALAVDAKGILYAATGDKGLVYRITPDGNASEFFSTRAAHALTLAFDPQGRLLVGTGSPGRVFRVDEAGKGFLLLDTSHDEVRALRFDGKGVLYAAAQSGRADKSGGDAGGGAEVAEPAPPTPVPTVSTEITGFAVIDVPMTAAATTPGSAPDRRGPTGAVYRVLPDGLWDQLWESRDDAPYDLAIEADGALLVATGGKGKIFRLAGEPTQTTLVTRVAAQQAVLLHRAAAGTLIVTSNPGLLLALAPGRAERGTYESDVRDARVVATWGTISWRARTPTGTRVDVQTRSGNTKTPDSAWSDWSATYADAEGSPITSPAARYLQWRAVLVGKGDSPVLTSVSAAYLQRNIRPQVDSITVHPPGVVFQKPFSSGETEIAGFSEDTLDRRVAASTPPPTSSSAPALGRRVYQKGLQTFIWKADDDNGDELRYDLFYRREGDTSWRALTEGLTETIYVWDTTSAPNGAYVVKVVASDRQSNPSDRALRGERESQSFDIDNTAPRVQVTATRREGGSIVVPFEVHDDDSPLSRVEYSVDAQRWQSVFPADGILDSRREQFTLRLDPTLAGRMLVIRVTDALQNVATGEMTLK